MFEEFGVLELFGLEDGQIFFQGVLFYGGAGEGHAAVSRLVRSGDNCDDVIAGFEDRVQGGDGEFGSSHEDNTRAAWHTFFYNLL